MWRVAPRVAHEEWVQTVRETEFLVHEDAVLQEKTAAGLKLKGRTLAPDVLGRLYAQYCRLLNRLYDHYLTNLQLQKLPYINEIIRTFTARVYELRKELVNLFINDYVYIDSALAQLHLTPCDIEILVPFHFPLELRPESVATALQQMWCDSERRKNPPPSSDDGEEEDVFEERERKRASEDSFVETESFQQARIIQQHERFRRFQILHNREQLRFARLFREKRPPSPPPQLKEDAAGLIQMVYRAYMKAKRDQKVEQKRDLLIGLVTPSYNPGLKLDEENAKTYLARMSKKRELMEKYWKDFETEKTRIVVWKRDRIIDDITDHVREWFRYWHEGYIFFPQFPFESEGGTIAVIRGDFETVEERQEEDERMKAKMKGKTADMLKEEKLAEKEAAAEKKIAERERMIAEAELLIKMRCDPRSDPGYTVETMKTPVVEALRDYRMMWHYLDKYPGPEAAGHLLWVITEDIMQEMHKECRIYVDEFMRLELKLLVAALKKQWKIWGYKYPKEKKRRPPPVPKVVIPPELNETNRSKIGILIDKGVLQNPKAVKIKDIIGDSNYYAYEYLTRDPDARFPPPSYGEVKNRLLAYAMGAVPESGAARCKSLLILGPPEHGKTFMVDAVCGELNALKFDISPEVFNRQFAPGKLALVCLAARLLQPAVIFLRNIERVFYKTVPKPEKYLKPTKLKSALGKILMKNISAEDKVMFIATCSDPSVATARPMAKLFGEVILVPRTDYGTASFYLHSEFMKCHGIPRDLCVQPLAQMLQGYGMGTLIRSYNNIMTPDRIVRLHPEPIKAIEFVEPLILAEKEPVTAEDYEMYEKWYLKNTRFGKNRAIFEDINIKRADVYAMMEKKEEKK